jgi:hypothetical protein
MAYRASKADVELAGAARRAGAKDVTPRKVWRWRRAGLIPPPTRRGLGQGRGTRSEYPPGTVEQVVEVARILKERKYLSDALLILFVRGRQVSDWDVKRIIGRRLVGFISTLADSSEPLEGEEDVFELAEIAGQRMLELPRLRGWRGSLRAQLRNRGIRGHQALIPIATDQALLWLGDEGVREDPSPEMKAAYGLQGGPDQAEKLSKASIGSMIVAIGYATPRQIELAREATLRTSAWTDEVVPVLRKSQYVKDFLAADKRWRTDRPAPPRAVQDLYALGDLIRNIVLVSAMGEEQFRLWKTGEWFLMRMVVPFYERGPEAMEQWLDDNKESIEREFAEFEHSMPASD